jgi:hypothetical protein
MKSKRPKKMIRNPGEFNFDELKASLRAHLEQVEGKKKEPLRLWTI